MDGNLLNMRKFLLFPALILSCVSHAATYYVKNSGGSGTGLSDAVAWNFTKLNAMAGSLQSGDVVRFNRGEIFSGALTIASSGIIFDVYGTGANPTISGLSTLSSWTLSSGNIYYASLDVPMLNMVTVDGVIQKMGRYPNTGYLSYTSHSGNNSITGTSVSAIPFNPANAELVVRKSRWITDRHSISSRTSNTLNITANNYYGNNSAYQPVDGNGYFIQNSLGALDQEGEWYYDTTANRLYMHFGSGTPSGRVVKAASVTRNLYINYWSNLTFNNIDFEGANIDGAYIIGTSNINFNYCRFTNQGGNGIYLIGVTDVSILGGSISNVLNNGIWCEDNGLRITVDGVNTNNTGVIAGAGRSGEGAQEGIQISGNSTKISNCTVINSGYNGIAFTGTKPLVEKNTVNTFCLVKDDGGGIYSHASDSGTIQNNTILNAIGAFAGVESYYYEAYGKAAGIYLDNGTSAHHATVEANNVMNGEWIGIFLNDNGASKIRNNTVTNFQNGLHLTDYTNANMRNLVVTGNRFISSTSTQIPLYIHMFFNDSPNLLGTFTGNVYSRPGSNNVIIINREYSGGSGENTFSLSLWKSTYGLDLGSFANPKVLKSSGKLLKRNGKYIIISN